MRRSFPAARGIWARRAALLLLAVGAAAGCGTAEQASPDERLADGIRATQESGSFEFTLDGEGEIARGEEQEDLFFASTGTVRFPDRVQMVVNIDQPSGGVRSEILQIGGIAYVRPSAPDAKWQRSQGPVELAGFDPLAVFDFDELRKTRVALDGGQDTVDGVGVHRIRLDAREEFRREVESRLPAGFENTTLAIRTEILMSAATQRIMQVVQRFEYSGATRGFFQTQLRLDKFGTDLPIEAPAPEELSEEPLHLPVEPQAEQ